MLRATPMKLLLNILGVLAAFVFLMVIVAFFLPRNFRVERGTVIKAKPEVVYGLVGDLRAWQKWTIWHERDPQMKSTFSEKTNVVGGWSAWESKSEGNGKMTFTAVEPTKRVVYALEFPDMDMKSTGTVTLTPDPDGTRVTWADEGDLGMNPISRWFGVFLDKMIGPDFEKGLAKLKTISEAPAK